MLAKNNQPNVNGLVAWKNMGSSKEIKKTKRKKEKGSAKINLE